MDPRSCVFRPQTLLCKSPSTSISSTYLTPGQVSTVSKLHNDWIEANSIFVFPGFELDAESSWSSTGPDPTFVGYLTDVLQLGPDRTIDDWNPSIIALSDALYPGNATADNLDISPFYERFYERG
jgi:feruloyl esterase